MKNPWELYDRLIAGIPENLCVEDYCVGCAWTMVTAGGETGIALTVRQRAGQETHAPLLGAPLREAAQLIKSWNFIEASLGMAAINAWYNRKSRVEALGILPDDTAKNRESDAFSLFRDSAQGKRVAVIGHFPNIERQLTPICQLSVLEREPQRGDYPDSACEYILPEQDFVYITGMTLTNKTLPRLLELIRPEAKVCLVGPSVPLADALFGFGANHLSAFCATDPEGVSLALRRGVKQEIFLTGCMVNLSKGHSAQER